MTNSTDRFSLITDAAVEAAYAAWFAQAALDGSIFEDNLHAALEAAAPHMKDSPVEEWAVQFGYGDFSDAAGRDDAVRRMHEIRGWIAEGSASPALEPMVIVRRYRAVTGERTEWEPAD